MLRDVIFMAMGLVGLVLVGAGIAIGHVSLCLVGVGLVVAGSFAVEG